MGRMRLSAHPVRVRQGISRANEAVPGESAGRAARTLKRWHTRSAPRTRTSRLVPSGRQDRARYSVADPNLARPATYHGTAPRPHPIAPGTEHRFYGPKIYLRSNNAYEGVPPRQTSDQFHGRTDLY